MIVILAVILIDIRNIRAVRVYGCEKACCNWNRERVELKVPETGSRGSSLETAQRAIGSGPVWTREEAENPCP